jgi:hypothetical protein
MQNRPIHCRRLRRTDADAVLALLAGALGTAPRGDRATLHRFRRLVADLGTDCYVAVADEALVGLVHVTYARHLLDRQRATVELLLLAPDPLGGDAAVALARLVGERVRQRGCRVVDWREPAHDDATRTFATHLGARPAAERLRVEIPAPAE